MVFPQGRLNNFLGWNDLTWEFDLPPAFRPEFPPPIFSDDASRVGDVSRAKSLNADNFDRLFRGLITPVQLDGAEDVGDAVSAGKSSMGQPIANRPSPAAGVTRATVNFHNRNQFHLNPDTRPQRDRLHPRHRGLGCSINNSGGSKRVCIRGRISPNSSSGRPISTAITFTCRQKG